MHVLVLKSVTPNSSYRLSQTAIYKHTHLILKCTPEPYNEGILSEGEDVSLVKYLLHLFLHGCSIFANLLHGKPCPCLFVSHQVYGSEGTERGGGGGGREE